MRLSTVDLQKRLNPDKPKGLPLVLTILIAWLAGAVFIFAGGVGVACYFVCLTDA